MSKPTRNPFSIVMYGRNMQHVDAESRIRAAKNFTFAECLRALELYGLQKTVEQAVRRRMNQLQFGAGAPTKGTSNGQH